MFIDLTCPAEIFRTVLPTEEIPVAALTLYNLSDRVIASVEVMLYLIDRNGTETEKLSYRGRALNGRPHSTFMMTVPCAAAGVCAAEVSIEKVWFQDNEVWRRNPANTVEYTPNSLPVSRALTNLQYVAGDTAVGFPALENGLWICVCGRPNPEEEPICLRCGRQRDIVFARFNQEAVEAQVSMREKQLDLNSRSMREDTIRLQRIREEEFRAKQIRRRRRIRLAVCLLLAPALCAGIRFACIPELQLLSAHRTLQNGDPEGAKAVFETLGTFGGADRMITECDWVIARKRSDESSTPEEMAEASALLRTFADNPEALQKANETDLARARLLFARGDRKGAEEALSLVPEGTGDRDALLRDCRMAQAMELLETGEYETARTIFLELTDLPGTADLAAECLYRPAEDCMAAEDWDGALEFLSRIPDYRDSRSLTLQCHYRKAASLEEAGDLDGAAAEFLMAGNWGNATERTAAITLRQADTLFEQGDLRGAHALYASLPDNTECLEKDRICRLSLARSAINSMEYTLALELLEGLPDDYEDAADLRAEASYQKAKNAVKQEDWETAVTLLSPLDRQALRRKYRDIENLYITACYGAGIEAYPTTPDPKEGNTPETTAIPDPVVPAENDKDGTSDLPTQPPFLVTEDDQP